MLNKLPQGVKISLTRSITLAFEQYMKGIQWSEDKYNLESFVLDWKEYAAKHASWYAKIDDTLKSDPAFHEELAVKINETITKILSEEPTPEQMNELEELIKKTGSPDIDYSCKAEAKFHIEQLKGKVK
jgi:hypothetical protein